MWFAGIGDSRERWLPHLFAVKYEFVFVQQKKETWIQKVSGYVFLTNPAIQGEIISVAHVPKNSEKWDEIFSSVASMQTQQVS